MTKAEFIERYGIDKYNEQNDIMRLRNHERYWNDSKYRDKHIAYMKEHQKKPEVKEYKKEYQKEYKKNDLNTNGKTKNNIRKQSSQILFDQRHHTKLKDYEIHHCFGYEDPSKFIYIPKSLHTKIHRFLRDNDINADTDHYKYISAIINECIEYTYISA